MGDHIEQDKIEVDKLEGDFVSGNKHITYIQHGEKEIPKYLGTFPLLSEVFLGREKDLADIHQQLHQQDNLLLLVNGEGGIGKTTLASHYYDRQRESYQHLIWIFAGNDLLNALLTIASKLHLEFPPAMRKEDRVQLLLQSLRDLGGQNLLIIDNANDVGELEGAYLALQSCHNFHVLLTSRISSFEQAAYHRILPLPQKEAFALFQQYYPGHDLKEDDLLEAILEAVGYNTLIIELLAKNLALQNELEVEYSLESLLKDLASKGLFGLSKTDKLRVRYQAKGPGLRKEEPESILSAMYELGELPEIERKLLSNFSVLPAESIPYKMLKDLLQAFGDLKKPLLSLSQKGWIEYEREEASFKVSPIVQEVCREKTDDLFQDCKGLIDRLNYKLDYQGGFGHLLHTSYKEAVSLSWYVEQIVARVKTPKYDLTLLCNKLGSYFTAIGNLDAALHYYGKNQEITLQLWGADPASTFYKGAIAVSLQDLGATNYSLGNLNEALQFYQQYNQLQKELYDSDPANTGYKNGLAISCEKLGDTHRSLGNLDQALRLYKEGAMLSQELYDAHPQNVSFKNGLAISYSRLGNTHRDLGNQKEALRFFQLYNRLEQELYDSFPQNIGYKNGLAISCEKLGDTHRSLGNLDQALRLYKEGAMLSQELYDAHPQNVSFKNGLAISYSRLGSTHSDLGKQEEALAFFELYNKLEQQLYDSFPQNIEFKNGLAISFSKLGDIHSDLGNLDEALLFFQESQKLNQELYYAYPQNVSFKNGLALSFQSLGVTLEKIGQQEQAQEVYHNSRQLLRELVEAAPGFVEFQKNLEWVEKRLKRIALKKRGIPQRQI